jgi:hypothetical protein
MALIESQSSAIAYAFASHVIRERIGQLNEGRLPETVIAEKQLPQSQPDRYCGIGVARADRWPKAT